MQVARPFRRRNQDLLPDKAAANRGLEETAFSARP